jgi:sterol desaturase/sphingolipid hydroxylase (fatty acid hydroxylase superfamily)
LPLWDVLFGTYYMPKDERPSRFGTMTPVRAGLIGQVVFPFRRQASAVTSPSVGKRPQAAALHRQA